MTKISKAGKTARVILAGGALLALSLGGAGVATAADGHLNQGISDLQVTPNAPAVNFETPGTPGTLSYGPGDGTAQGSADVKAGDTMRYSYGLPEGLEFPADFCDTLGEPTAPVTITCELGPLKRGLVVTQTATANFSLSPDFNSEQRALRVVSTGAEITGQVTMNFQPWTGLTTQTPSAAGPVVQTPSDGVPLIAGGVLAAGALGAGALVMRRRRAAA